MKPTFMCITGISHRFKHKTVSNATNSVLVGKQFNHHTSEILRTIISHENKNHITIYIRKLLKLSFVHNFTAITTWIYTKTPTKNYNIT